MNHQDYLKTYQPILYRTFTNAMAKNQVSHAYLLVGEPGIPLLNTAIYLAKSLLCDNPHPLACDECFTCLRIDDGNYADFILLDGSSKTIKKDDIQRIEIAFEKTALESKGIMIYVIHLVENMTAEAINSLLKFLEEPQANIYAFLTTENELKVLPTILSRTQKLPLRYMPQKDVIDEAVNIGIAKNDAELLSFYYNESTALKEASLAETYLSSRDDCLAFLEALINDSKQALYIMQKQIAPKIRSKENARFLLDLLIVFFQEAINYQSQGITILESYQDLVKNLASLHINFENVLLELMNGRGQLDLNINIALLLDHLVIFIMKGDDINGRNG